jgi:hypothetical protein
MDLLSGDPDVDVIVATTSVPETVTILMVAGLPFLTVMGVYAAMDEVIRHLSWRRLLTPPRPGPPKEFRWKHSSYLNDLGPAVVLPVLIALSPWCWA